MHWAVIKEDQLEIRGLESIMGEIRKLILDGWNSVVGTETLIGQHLEKLDLCARSCSVYTCAYMHVYVRIEDNCLLLTIWPFCSFVAELPEESLRLVWASLSRDQRWLPGS